MKPEGVMAPEPVGWHHKYRALRNKCFCQKGGKRIFVPDCFNQAAFRAARRKARILIFNKLEEARLKFSSNKLGLIVSSESRLFYMVSM